MRGKWVTRQMAVLLAAVLVAVSACSAPQPEQAGITEFLSLGEQYLTDLDYDQALVEFLKVIEIEPCNARAYLGAADAYIGRGQTEDAIAILRRGLEETDNEAIRAELAKQLALPHIIRSETDDGGLYLAYGQEDLDGRLQGFCIVNVYDAAGNLTFAREGNFVDGEPDGVSKYFWYNAEKQEYGLRTSTHVNSDYIVGYDELDCYTSVAYDRPEDDGLVRFDDITGIGLYYSYRGNRVGDSKEDDTGTAYQMWIDENGHTVEYVGQYKNDDRNGYGRMWSTEGWEFEGFWVNGEPVE